jgi:hypothetical protein
VAQPWRRAARVRRSGMQVPVRIFRVVPPGAGAVRCGAVGGQLRGSVGVYGWGLPERMNGRMSGSYAGVRLGSHSLGGCVECMGWDGGRVCWALRLLSAVLVV